MWLLKVLVAVFLVISLELAFFIQVGGSLAGLMHGIVIKRLGNDVTILEQHQSSTREGQAAGIVTLEYSQDFLDRHDLLKNQPYAVNCSSVQFLDKNMKVKMEFQRSMMMTTWNVLYYRLRANLDGVASSYCTQTPAEPTDIGRALYDQVEIEDLVNRSISTVSADQVIVANGSTSQMRHLLQPQLRHSYASYFAWRVTVIESTVSHGTRNIFQNKTALHATSGGYIALYTIPGENGSLEPGKRLLNYVWYTNIAAGSSEF
ncbi:MAG: hypothetical protein Q9226_004316 [Calogaya cf. arnoldii]